MSLKPEHILAKRLETERLVCKLLDLTDQGSLEYLADSFNTDGLRGSSSPDGTWAAENVRRLAYSIIMDPSDTLGRQSKDACLYLMHLANDPDGKPIGYVSLCQRTPGIPPDLGYSLDSQHRGKGYTSEAATRLTKYLREELGLKKICIVTRNDNTRSRKLAERIGYVDGGYLTMDTHRLVAYVLPGMEKMEGQNISFWGRGEILNDY